MEQDLELTVDKNYLKGFNQGYVLTEHTPDLVTTLLKNDLPANGYFSGFKAGKQEFEMEKIRERLKGVPRNDAPAKNVNKDKGRER